MADQDIAKLGINIEAQADLDNALKDLSKAFKQITEEARKAGEEVSKNFSQFLQTGGNAGFLGTQTKLGTEFSKVYKDQFRPALDTAIEGLKEFNPALEATGVSVTGLVRGTLGSISSLEQWARTIDPISKNLWLLSAGMQKIVSVLLPLSAGITAFGVVSIKNFAEIEQATKDLQASLGTTPDVVEKIQKQFRGLSMEMPITTGQFLEMARSAAEAGVSAEAITPFVKVMGELVTITGEVSSDEVSESLVNISKAFGLSVGNVRNSVSVLRKLAKDSSVQMDDFIDSLRRASPAAKNLGITFQQTAGILATLIPVSEGAERAGTRLNNMFTRMATNLPELASQLGRSQEEMSALIQQDAGEVFINYIERLGQVESYTDRVKAATELLGEEGAKGVLALTDQTEELRQAIAEANEEFITGETLTNDYAIAANTLANRFKTFKNTLTEVTLQFGAALAPLASEVLGKITNTLKTLIAIWVGLPAPIKTAIKVIGGFLTTLLLVATAVASVGLAITTLGSGIATTSRSLLDLASALAGPFLGGVVKAKAAIVGLGVAIKASFWQITLIIAGVSAAIYGLVKLLQHFGVKLPDFGGMLKKAFGLDGFDKNLAIVNAGFEQLTKNAGESVENVGKSFSKLNGMALEWGNKFLEKYLYAFSEADYKLLNETGKIVEQYYDILEKTTEMSVEEATENVQRIRGVIAQGIEELKTMGKVSSETFGTLTNAVGSGRAESIVKQLMAGLKVEGFEEVVKALKTDVENKRKAEKKEVDIIEKQIKEREKYYKNLLDKEEASLKLVEEEKKALEKTYKAERDIMEDEVDMAKEKLEDAKDALSELKRLRGDEVDAAEGLVDYARMNLEAAQNVLEREKILGKDEYDASFRAAKARVESAEKQLELANESLLKAKNSFKREIKASEEKVVTQEALVDILEKSLKDFKKKNEEEIEAVQARIDVYKEGIDKLKEQQDTAVESLRAEKDMVQDKYDTELRILEEKLENAENSLRSEEEIYNKIKRINDEYMSVANSRLQSLNETSGLVLPESGFGGGTLPTEDLGKLVDVEPETKKKDIFGFLFGTNFKDAKKLAEDQGKSLGKFLWDGYVENIRRLSREAEIAVYGGIYSILFGEDSVEQAKQKARENGTSFSWELFKGYAEELNRKKEEVKQKIYDTFLNPNNLEEYKANLRKAGEDFVKAIINGWNSIKNVWNTIKNWVKTNILDPIGNAIKDVYNRGKDIITNLINGLWSKVSQLWSDVVYILGTIRNYFTGLVSSANSWGWNLLVEFVNGLIRAIKDSAVGRAISWVAEQVAKFFRSNSPPEIGPLSTIDKWGVGLMKTYAESIKKGIPYVENAINGATMAMKEGINVPVDLTNSLSAPVAPVPVYNQTTQEGTKYYIQAGTMVASEGEVRAFARMLMPYLQNEQSRIGG